MSCEILDGANKPWVVPASLLARNTQNTIRNVVEKIKVKPNPDKPSISLSIGDPTLFGNIRPPPELLKAVYDCIELDGCRSYGPTVGLLSARQAVATHCSYQGKVSAEDVVLCNGCAHALEMAITVLTNPGENILVPRPGYMIYKTITEGLGINIKYYDLLPNDHWKINLDDLENKLDAKTAAIIILNPSNPCGSVYTEKHLCDVLDIASRNRVPIIADEIYEFFTFSGHNFTSIASVSKDVPILVCSGLSKRYLVPGWRMGWLVIHDRNGVFGDDIRIGLFNLSGRILGPNRLIQQALPKILTSVPRDYFNNMMLFIESQAKLAFGKLQCARGLRPIMPQGAMYMMIEIDMSIFPQFHTDTEFVEALYGEQSVMCIPGQCFFYPNYIRIVLTVPDNILQEACSRIQVFCHDNADDSALKTKKSIN
ncbi:tyrosine aminotransferase-like [Plodia interpunctella]|uniref:tyrosine aminotransferase-like n=1 Tax=Plodia interpunctella TaxID=58824 RepID=UPI0023675F3D|nr:tyrosine aminotransferase-like [Plodia interpunctella]XP_053618756.1 tyrosine aminotransferase-like [Plodia interpunctella]